MNAIKLIPKSPAIKSDPIVANPAELSDNQLMDTIFNDSHNRVREKIGNAIDSFGLLSMTGLDPIAIMTVAALSPAQAVRFSAITELARRIAMGRRPERISLTTPESVRELMGPLVATKSHEEFWCLPMDPRKQLIGRPRIISRGDIDGTDAGPRLFTREALLAHSSAAIAVHNHPTGDPAPSAADRAVTVRLVSACRTVDVPLLDHIIIGDGGRFVSLRRDSPELFR